MCPKTNKKSDFNSQPQALHLSDVLEMENQCGVVSFLDTAVIQQYVKKKKRVDVSSEFTVAQN